ncbi:tumor necrosis factor ligand superfamily member 13B [Clupea harengus]|uniref:Tumor necrosis factor ligand superfamily member 13B n=1 Tax=Clupea harengus TaxID=7950 RepID=A0A6P8H102_CLUHA|nr:tumor necrosis factor ligand superfamily member 13B [Clupea harengus]XP_031440765.1 tumor necrosis factor ligand superfamily member 13B [Clupea harengus]XP_031440772.1 tumor necrosis factor ligand superfamily member 13B [Clupea harengus]XP_031440780.1 tumor necrosis factor ligand superfamily member 13B [Clupea harengus]
MVRVNGAGGGRRGGVPWMVALLALAAVTSSSLSALSLYRVLALQAEVEGLRSEVNRRREERWGAPGEAQQQRPADDNWTQTEQQRQLDATSETVTDKPERHAKRSTGEEQAVLQPCLQMLADNKRATFQKEFALVTHTGIPWQTGLRRGTALELREDIIQVNEEGFFFIYSQVHYTDPLYAMGHIIIRMKKNVVGDERQHVILFRCIQNMNKVYPSNTCYTGGIAKLEVGDKVELLIPRPNANVSLDGDFTFLGAIKLA